MFSLHVLSFLISFINLQRYFASSDEPAIIDLSIINYTEDRFFGNNGISFSSLPEIETVQAINFENLRSNFFMKCSGGQNFPMMINLKKDINSISIPFIASCQNSKVHTREFKLNFGISNISIFVESSSYMIKSYVIYCINGQNEITHEITSKMTSHVLVGLKEKSWYQICVSVIDSNGLQRLFKCQKNRTDFSTTGPVTNALVTVVSSSEITVQWNEPDYKQDIPHRYVVKIVRSNSEYCSLFIIDMTSSSFEDSINNQYDHMCTSTSHKRHRWYRIQSLNVNDLTPYTHYDISIYPINNNKPSASTTISIQTKEGKSDAVRDLSVEIGTDWLKYKFESPINSHGVITKYKIRIVQKKFNMCKNVDNEIHLSYEFETRGQISVSKLKQCGLYEMQVTPINGWNQNNGEGYMATTEFNYFIKWQSNISVDKEFLSSNAMQVNLRNIIHHDRCKINAFVIVISDKHNPSDCVANANYDSNCGSLTAMIKNNINCRNIVWIHWDPNSLAVNNFLAGLLYSENKYEMAVLRITNEVVKTNTLSIVNKVNQDCFTDCTTNLRKYTGIRSADENGYVCKLWNQANHKYRRYKSNFCSTDHGDKTWCTSQYFYNQIYCDIPKCSDIPSGTGCTPANSMDYSDSITVDWSPPPYNITIIGYIILLHNTDNVCEQTQIQFCHDCESKLNLTVKVKNFFLSCNTSQYNYSITYKTPFSDLDQNKLYFVYIIPIIDQSTVGEVKKLSVQTLISKPKIPQEVSLRSRSRHHIELSWTRQYNFRKYGQPDNYTGSMRQAPFWNVKKITVIDESLEFNDLKICSKYCFSVKSNNRAGSSEYTEEMCFFTLASKPEKVVLEDPVSGYSTRRLIKWKPENGDDCTRLYRIEYFIKSSWNRFDAIARESNIELTNLKRNALYVVRVRAENEMDAVHYEKFGEYSEDKEFYTGLMQWNLSTFDQKVESDNKILTVVWKISDEVKGSIQTFMVVFKDIANSCAYVAFLGCRNCEKFHQQDPDSWPIDKMAICANLQNQTFEEDETYFNYSMSYENLLNNFSVEIYHRNPMGIHKLIEMDGESIKSPRKFPSLFPAFIVVIIVLISIILVIMIKKYMDSVKNSITSGKSDSKIKDGEDSMKNSAEKNKIGINNYNAADTAVMVSEFSAYFNCVSENKNEEMVNEFNRLTDDFRKLQNLLGLTVVVGNDPKNYNKNRFPYIVPYDQNRVKIAEKGCLNDYVNASYIPFENDESKVEYIAAQGLINGCLSEFWQMIWEQNVTFIIMLTETVEDNRIKCLQYWPNDVGEQITYKFKNEYVVTLMSSKENLDYSERVLYVQKNGKVERKIFHLQMHSWMDHFAPEIKRFDIFLTRFQEVFSNNAVYPILVHCSAGVGATGTFICIDRIVKGFWKGSREINIFETVIKLRSYRNYMVQEIAQYIFIYEYIYYFLKKCKKIRRKEEEELVNEYSSEIS